jgi:hypothetical protein
LQINKSTIGPGFQVGSMAWLLDYTLIDISTRYIIIVVTAKNKVDQIININFNTTSSSASRWDPFPDLAKDYDGALWSVSIATTKASW